MKTVDLSLLALGLATSAHAVGTNVRAVARPPTYSSTPAPSPSVYYTSVIYDTTFQDDGFYLHVELSGNTALEGKNLQLHSGGIVDVDNANSPTLKLQLRNKNLYQVTNEVTTGVTYTGLRGGLQNVSSASSPGTTRQDFLFKKDIKSAPKSFQQSQGGWSLTSLDDHGTYGLYHDEPVGYSNGFEICHVTPKGQSSYYQLRYVVSNASDGGGTVKGCEYIGLQTTIAPVLNGTFYLPPEQSG